MQSMKNPPNYLALALQTTCYAVNGDETIAAARDRMARSLERIRAQILASKRFAGSDVKLVVLPEYFLTGFPFGESAPVWLAKAALDQDGLEYKALGALAQEADIYLAGNAYEQDPNFPELYFQCSFIFSPLGDCILRYRRLISLFAPSPFDVYDRYVEIYGADALFPVADTEIGRIAAIASEEILYPEIARAHALRGAELFVHSSSEVGSILPTQKNIAKQARAFENLAYVVSANSAGIENVAIPKSSTDAGSKVVDYKGLILAESGFGESMAANAEINIAALRQWRRRPGMPNMLSRQPTALWREAYSGVEIQPRNSLLDENGKVIIPSPAWYAARQRQVIETMSASGRI
jgi:predicted amidohydrolase